MAGERGALAQWCSGMVTGGAAVITYVVCDLFRSPARVLVNTVNTVGVMGKGIAKDFKQIYPEMFKQYQEICEKGSFGIGNLWLYKTTNKWVLNFPTKRHWRQPSRPEYIAAGLKKFADVYHVYGITSISFPLIGCGNGELDWETQVQPLMEQYLGKLPIDVFIHRQDIEDPFEHEHRNVKAMREWLRGEPESLAFSEVWDDLCSLSDGHADLSTLDTSQRFRVAVGKEAEGLSIHKGENEEYVPAEALLELWQQIRQSGFVLGKNLPYGLDAHAGYILPMMARLPYVEMVTMADRYDKSPPQSIGLRLVVRPRPSELPLFAGVGAVEPE